MATETTILRKAEFNPKLKTYWLFSGLLVCVVSVIGIPLLPIVVPVLLWRMGELFDSLECTLTERSLILKRGKWFRTEKTVPLNKIQDLSLRHGPLLNYLGLSKITLETAGQSGGGAGEGDAVLTGVIDAKGFRDAVLAQRDKLEEGTASPVATTASEPASSHDETVLLLREIRDTLARIEQKDRV